MSEICSSLQKLIFSLTLILLNLFNLPGEGGTWCKYTIMKVSLNLKKVNECYYNIFLQVLCRILDFIIFKYHLELTFNMLQIFYPQFRYCTTHILLVKYIQVASLLPMHLIIEYGQFYGEFLMVTKDSFSVFLGNRWTDPNF